MSVPVVAERVEAVEREDTSDAQETLQAMIRLLLDQMVGPRTLRSSELSGSEASEEILLDVDVDGARYLLIRMPVMNALRAQLSPREHEIVRMVALGHANKIIADFLGISTWTVGTHLRRIFAKLGVGSRAAMVAKVLETPNARRPAASAAVNGR